MLRNKFYSILLLGFTSVFVQVEQAHAERAYGQIEPPRFQVGRLALKYEMDRFQARDNFDINGKTRDLIGDFTAYNAYLGLENDLSFKWSVAVGAQLGVSTSESLGESRTNTEIKGLQFGVSRVLTEARDQSYSGFNIISDFKLFFSLHNNNINIDAVSVGDGSGWAQAGLWFGTDKFENIRLWLYGGVNWPFRSFSKNFVFIARPEFKIWKGRVGVGVEGQIPFIDDGDLKNPTTRLRIADEYNAGSFYYQPINAQFAVASVWFGFEPVSYTEIKFGLGEVVYGKSTTEGLRAFVSLEFSFSGSRSGFSYPYRRAGKNKDGSKENSRLRRLKNYSKPKK